jgi:hypothetical protein
MLTDADGCWQVTALLIGHSLSLNSNLRSSLWRPFPCAGAARGGQEDMKLVGSAAMPVIGVLTVRKRALVA